jgi:transposase
MQSKGLDDLYRTTKDPRLRTRAQMVLLAAGQRPAVPQIAAIVREREAPVLRWLKRYRAEGLNGLQDAPRPGRPWEITAEYRAALLAAVRRRPRRLHLPFFLWTLIFSMVFNIWQLCEITEFWKVDSPSALGLFGALDPSVYCGVAVRLYEGSENQRIIGQCLELVQK